MKKRKLMLSNRALYTFIILGISILVLSGVYAFGTSNPSVFGHSASEINWTGTISNLNTTNINTDNICLDGNCKSNWSEIDLISQYGAWIGNQLVFMKEDTYTQEATCVYPTQTRMSYGLGEGSSSFYQFNYYTAHAQARKINGKIQTRVWSTAAYASSPEINIHLDSGWVDGLSASAHYKSDAANPPFESYIQATTSVRGIEVLGGGSPYYPSPPDCSSSGVWT